MPSSIEFSWMTIVPTIVGGAISAVSAVCMFLLAQRAERRKRAAEKRRDEAMRAFQGFWKLRGVANGLWNYERQISECYEDAERNGFGDSPPSSKAKPLVGALDNYDLLEVQEFMFLGRQKRTILMNDIDLIVRRARNVEAVVSKYNEQKASFENFIEDHAEEIEVIDGPIVATKFGGRLGVLAELREGSMNNLLGQLHEALDVDCKEARRVTEEYLDAARAEFGDDFPKFKFEWLNP
jgi:hypothetical protein